MILPVVFGKFIFIPRTFRELRLGTRIIVPFITVFVFHFIFLPSETSRVKLFLHLFHVSILIFLLLLV